MTDFTEEARKLLRKAYFLFPRHYKETEAELAAALSAAYERGRQEAFDQSIKICEHAIEHYKGPVAHKILREIRVAAIRKDQP